MYESTLSHRTSLKHQMENVVDDAQELTIKHGVCCTCRVKKNRFLAMLY